LGAEKVVFRDYWSKFGTPTFLGGITNSIQGDRGHVQVGSLGGAPHLGKDILGTLRSAQSGQKSDGECKGKSRPDGTLDSEESRGESLA
jgi:hypothetical protein